MELKIYHNPRCKKSRAGLEYLATKNISPEIILYLNKNPFTFEKLKEILIKMNVTAFEMIRKNEPDYKMNYKGKEFSNDEWIEIMIENPKLINRPIVESDNKAVWGEPVENIDKILKK